VVTFVPLLPSFPTENYTTTISATKRLDDLGTVRGRLGFVTTPNLLIYATGGFAYGHASSSTSITAVESLGNPPYPPPVGFSNVSTTRTGWTAGAGAEWLFYSNWTARIEYLYYDLGSLSSSGFTLTQNNPPVPGWGIAAVQSLTPRFNGNIVRVGLNYKFGYDAVPAVYR
jgi:outer membrane immunogenic protein